MSQKKAAKRAVHSNKSFSSFDTSKGFQHNKCVFTLKTVMSMKTKEPMKIIQWDGV